MTDADELDAALRAAGLARTGEPQRLTSVSNRVYRVDTDGGPVAVRLPTRERAGVDHAVEHRNMAAAAAAGLAPEALHADHATGLLVSRFVAGRAATPDDLRGDPALVDAIGRALRRVHTSLSFANRFDPLAVLAELGAAAGRGLDELRPVLDALGRAELDLVACHNDPWPGNVVVGDDGVVLVDWEYSGRNDAAWDLADLAVEAALDDDGEEALLRAYGGGVPDERLRLRVAMWKPVADALWSAWSRAEHAAGNRADDFEAEATRRLARAHDLLPAALAAAAELGAG